MDSIWQQHKSFILKILAGLGVCLVCWIIGASLSDANLSDLEKGNRSSRRRIKTTEVPDSATTGAVREAATKLENRIVFTAQRIGETREGEDLRRGIIEGLLRRYGMESDADRDRYLNMARQSPVACVIDLAGKARDYLITMAGRNSVLLTEDVGYDKLSMEAGQFDRYLITLDSIVTIAETAIRCGVREVRSISIGTPPGGRFEGEDVFIREYPVTVQLRGPSKSLIQFIESLNDPDRLLVLTDLDYIRRDKSNRDPDMLIGNMVISALRIDPKAEIRE
ncbi:MAG: hypothetical protein ABFS86_12630 [Planctomycetota bacterium]